MKPKDETIPTPADVTGVIMPNRWDNNGRIIEIAIYTGAEEVYRVEPNRLAHEIMMNFMHKRIAVQGRITERLDGNMTIAIQKFSVLEEIVDDDVKKREMNMKTKRCRCWYLIACMLLTIILPPICHADDRARDRASLRGIENIVVRVHSFEREWAAELAKSGLTESVVQATIERQLEKSGIEVISEEASKRTGTEGILNVRTNFLNPEPLKKKFITAKEEEIEKFDPQKRYVYVIRLNLRQPVLLQRNPEAPISAITWQTESVGFRRLALIREDIEKVVNVFSEAYLSENPGIKPVD